jgi:hypothetical protein
MEFVIAVALVISTIANIVIFKRLQNLQPHPISVELSPPVTGLIECGCKEELFAEVKAIIGPLVEKESVQVPSPPDESYSAWRNHKEEPSVAPPSPHGPPPKPGPLERPYGFSR